MRLPPCRTSRTSWSCDSWQCALDGAPELGHVGLHRQCRTGRLAHCHVNLGARRRPQIYYVLLPSPGRCAARASFRPVCRHAVGVSSALHASICRSAAVARTPQSEAATSRHSSGRTGRPWLLCGDHAERALTCCSTRTRNRRRPLRGICCVPVSADVHPKRPRLRPVPPFDAAEQRSGWRIKRLRCLSPQGEFLSLPPDASSAG